MKTELYEGWTNSRTYLTNLYLLQELLIYEKLVAIVKVKPVTAKNIHDLWDHEKHEPCDSWANGFTNWQEIADTFNAENYQNLTSSQAPEAVIK